MSHEDTRLLTSVDAASAFGSACAAYRDSAPAGEDALGDIINTLMTELWDQSFSQSEIRQAFEGALADMNRYAGGEERRS